MLNFVFFSAFIINESAVLVQVHKHRHAGEAWLTVIREKPMRLRKDQSDLIYSQRSQVVTPIKSSGLMLPPPYTPPGLDQTPAVFTEQRRGVTHTGAAHEDHTEGLHDASDAHHPSEPQEEDDAKDVLQAREVHAHEGAHAWGLPERPASVSTAPTQYQQPSPHLLHVPSLPLLACLSPLSSLFPLALASFSPFHLPPGSSRCLPRASFKIPPSSSPPPSSFISHSFPYPHSHRPPSFFCVIHSSIQIHFLSHPFSPKAPPAPASFFHPHCSPLLHALYFPGAGWCSWPAH